MPPFSDSVLGVDSGFRRALFGRGMVLRVNVVPRYSQNLLDGRAPSGQQVYIGHRPTLISGVNPIFTADLRQLGLRQAQLNVGFGWRYTTWQPAGPNSVGLTTLYLFKRWGGRRVELKAGYVTNDLEFVGLEGNGVLLIGEVGYQRPSSAAAPQAWLRAGHMRNSTAYIYRLTGQGESGNFCAYVLMDYQVRMPTPAAPARGLFIGGTAMTVPSELNAYDRYYEARVYQRGTFSSRPTDVVALVASYRGHSQYFTDRLVAQGKTVWRSSSSFTGTYTLHVTRKKYLSLSLGYVKGPALSPRVDDTLTFTVNSSLYL
jgi:hypothetical protein